MRYSIIFSALWSLPPVIALWTVGLVATPRPEILAGLFLATLAAGFLISCLAVKFWKRQGISPALCFLGLAGLADFLGAFVFIAALFYSWNVPAVMVNTTDSLARANESAQRLRIVNFNIAHGYPDFPNHEKRAAVLVALLKDQNADVIILQDVWNSNRHGNFAEELAKEFGMNLAYIQAAGSRRLLGFEDGLAILSRYPVASARRISVSPQRPFWLPRPVLLAEILLNGDQRAYVANVHLGTGDFETGEAQVVYLKNRLVELLDKSSLVIAVGDFHEGKFSSAVTDFARALFMRDYIPGGRDEDHFLVRAGSGWSVADVRLVFSPQEIQRYAGENLKLSDHLAIRGDLVRRPPL